MKLADKNMVALDIEEFGIDEVMQHSYVLIDDPKFHELRRAIIKTTVELMDYVGAEDILGIRKLL